MEVKTTGKPTDQTSTDKKPQRQAPPPLASAYKQDKTSSDTSEPVEVENEVTMFDTESEDEEEQQVKPQISTKGQSSSKTTGGGESSRFKGQH